MRRLPLYQCKPLPERTGNGNPGLWWAKFCDQWQDFTASDFSGLRKPAGEDPGGKNRWIEDFTKGPVGDAGTLGERKERTSRLVDACAGRAVELTLHGGPFVTGTGLEHPVENGFAWHHSLGVPYLPGSGVKGLVRSWTEDVLEDGAVNRIFGPRPRSAVLETGSVVFMDALPVAPVALVMEVMTPHYAPWYQASDPSKMPPADWYDPTPIPFLAVKPGATFQFAVMPRSGAPDGAANCAKVFAWLEEALEWLGAGAKTAIGFGRFLTPGAVGASDAAPAAAAEPAPEPARRYFVQGEEVEIMNRLGGEVTVRFLDSGDIEAVGEDEVEEA